MTVQNWQLTILEFPVLYSQSLSSGGTYADEGIYIQRRSTPVVTSVAPSRASSGYTSEGDVPGPARYRSPTKEQLEESGKIKIPDHIVSRLIIYFFCYG